MSSLTSTRQVITMGNSIYWDTTNNKWVTPPHTQLKEPIFVTIRPIIEFLSSAVLSRAYGLSKALDNYASYRGARPSSDSSLTVPFVWPTGSYGLVQSVHGCPLGNWNPGYRYHDTEDDDSNNHWSGSYSLAGYKEQNNMKWEFCMKLSNFDTVNYQWPKGQYCILKKYGCPSGFGDGSVYWDDEDEDNENSVGGTLPDGSYDRNTRIDFCCRQDGDPGTAIVLPTSRPFILVAATGRCQKVHGMSESLQWFYWDDEDDDNEDSRDGMSPYDTGGRGNHKLHFCYYT